MSNWPQLLTNPDAMSMYDRAPSLGDARCTSVLVDPSLSAIDVALDLNGFPEHPPAQWEKGANAVALTLQLLGVQNFSVVGKLAEANQPVTACTLSQAETHQPFLDFACLSPQFAVVARCESAKVTKICGYHRLPEGSFAY